VGWTLQGFIPSRDKGYSVLHNVKTGFGTLAVFYSLGTGDFLFMGKVVREQS
jgi:hypothetical protein